MISITQEVESQLILQLSLDYFLNTSAEFCPLQASTLLFKLYELRIVWLCSILRILCQGIF